MDNSTPISEDVKNKTYSDITDIMIMALEKGAMAIVESENASNYILQRLDSLEDQTQLDAFLEVLAKRWMVFQPLLIEQKEAAEKKEDNQTIQNIQSEINSISQ
jgi:hypothetical protein